MTATVFQPGPIAPQAPERETNGYASAALAFSVVGVVVLGVMCAIAALYEIENPGEGRGRAIAALLISGGWVVLLCTLAHMHVI